MAAARTHPPAHQPDLGIAAPIVAAVLDVLSGMGFDVGDEGCIDPATTPIVPGSLADRWVDAAAERLRDDSLGITMARRIPIGGLGLIDYALCTSATLRDALGRVARHYGIATERVRVNLIEAPPHAALVFQRLGDNHSRHWIEFSFAILAERIRQTMGVAVGFEPVAFRHVAPVRAEPYEAFFGAGVMFGQSEDRLGFPWSLLDAPLRTASSSLAAVLDSRMSEIDPGEQDDAFLGRARVISRRSWRSGTSVSSPPPVAWE